MVFLLLVETLGVATILRNGNHLLRLTAVHKAEA
jgi:hypothetical protein